MDRVVQTLAANADPLAGNVEPSVQRIANMLDIIFHGSSRDLALRHSEFYRSYVHIDPNMERPARSYKDFVPARTKKSSSRRIFSYWCFNPGIAMNGLRLKYGIASVILTSGTLSPLQSFATELQTQFDVTLENPHVIGNDQFFAGVIKTGPANTVLNSSFKTRNELSYKSDLGNAIVNVLRA
eukprot:SAG31_NODE_13104_length_892_cov_1.257251_2_plen_183_part_00